MVTNSFNLLNLKKFLAAVSLFYSLNSINNCATAQIKNAEPVKKLEQNRADSLVKKFNCAKELLDLEKQAGFNVQYSDYQTLNSLIDELGKDVFFGGVDEKSKKIQAINNLENIDLTLKKNRFIYKNEPDILFYESLKTKNFNSFHFLVLYLEVLSKKNFQIVPIKTKEHFFAGCALDSLNFINWETAFGREQSEDLHKKITENNKGIKRLTKEEFLSGEYRTIGFFLNKNKQFEKSIEYFEKAIEMDSLNPLTYKNLGDSYAALNNYDSALKNYSTAINLNESFLEAYSSRAEAFYKKNNLKEALKDYTKAIELAPENPEFYKNRGDIYSLLYRKTGNLWKEGTYPKEAQKDYKKALELILEK